ncbi:MAG TPA: M48 family metalloprotease [Phycisphaerae bacterium]|nr:M48 family metalloprotease [Phycisphaerae bacterium]
MAVIVVQLLLDGELLKWRGPWWLASGAVCGYLFVAAALSRLSTLLALRSMFAPGRVPPAAIRRHGLLSVLGQLWLVGGLAAVALAGYGQWVVRAVGSWPVPLVPTLLVLAPFLAAVGLRWVLEYPFQREMRRRVAAEQAEVGLPVRPPWTLGEYLSVNLRYELMLIGVPLAIVLAIKDVLRLYALPLLPKAWAGSAVTAGTVAGALAVLLLCPALLVWIWRARPLPGGPLREALEEICRQAKARFRRILVWPSAMNVTNAAVLGAVGRLRYVLLSDALLEYMDERDVRAVFAHEAKHAAAHHVPYMVLFACCTAVLSAGVGELAARIGGGGDVTAALAGVAVLMLAWGALFGWISRRLERQCDVFAAWVMSRCEDAPGDRRISHQGAAAFAWALQRIAQLNGMSLTRHNWRHGSIASRVEHVLHLGQTGGTTEGIDRQVRRIKIGLWAAAAAAGMVLAMLMAWAA